MKECFANQEVVDLKNLEVTLDLICDTLPPSWLIGDGNPGEGIPPPTPTETDYPETGFVSGEFCC